VVWPHVQPLIVVKLGQCKRRPHEASGPPEGQTRWAAGGPGSACSIRAKPMNNSLKLIHASCLWTGSTASSMSCISSTKWLISAAALQEFVNYYLTCARRKALCLFLFGSSKGVDVSVKPRSQTLSLPRLRRGLAFHVTRHRSHLSGEDVGARITIWLFLQRSTTVEAVNPFPHQRQWSPTGRSANAWALSAVRPGPKLVDENV